MFASPRAAMVAGLRQLLRPITDDRIVSDRRWVRFLGSVTILGFLFACAAAGVPETNDPAEKLNYARLLLRDFRPLPAERLIGESMEIYQSRSDRGGLADAQYLYAKFLAGGAVKFWASVYRKEGFRDPTITFDTRREAAVRNYKLAASGFVAVGNFAEATNAYFDLGLAQANNGDDAFACRSFSDSLKHYYTYFNSDPMPENRIPGGYDSYEDLVITVAASAGCPKAQAANTREIGDDRADRELALAEDSHVLARTILGPDHPAVIPGMRYLAARYEDRYRFEEAEKNLRAALELSRKSSGVDSKNTLALMRDLTRFHVDRRQLAEAERLARETLDLKKKALGEDHRETLESMADLATAIKLQRRPDEAESIYRQALELSQQALDDGDSDTLQRMRDLGFFYYGQGRYDEAEIIYLELAEEAASSFGDSDPFVLGVNEELAKVYEGQGKLAQASKLREQVLERRRTNTKT